MGGVASFQKDLGRDLGFGGLDYHHLLLAPLFWEVPGDEEGDTNCGILPSLILKTW